MPASKKPRATSQRRSSTRRATSRRPSSSPKPAPRGLSLEKLVGLPQYKLPVLSHGRDRIAYFFDGTGRNELYLLPLDRPRPRQLSHGEVPRALRLMPTWDREDRSLFFGKDVQGNENHDLYRIWTENGRVERLTEDPTSEKHAIDVSPDGRWLLLAGNLSGRGGRRQFNLWRLALGGKSAPEQLTDHPNPSSPIWVGHAFSPDGKRIVYSTNELADLKNQDVYWVPAEGGTPERILRVREGSQEAGFGWTPDGRFLGVVSDATGNMRPGLMDTTTLGVRWFGHPGWEEGIEDFSPDGTKMLTFGNAGVATRAWVYDVETGAETPLRLPEGTSMMGRFTADGRRIVLHHTDVHQPWQFVLHDPTTHGSKLLLAPVVKGIDPKAFFPCETVRYRSFDGREIEALLFLPRWKGKPHSAPALVEVHGGPTWQFFRTFNPYAQYLASLGYTVLEPNVRGSTGYGVEFRDMNRKDWGGGDLKDVVAGAEYLRSLPHVDPNRVGIFGGSYGGYMTYMAVTKRPDAWKAACAIVGITDLHRMWERSKEHFRYFLRENMGDPQADRDLWRDRSAVYFAENLQAKLLMLHGVNDPRCPVDQAQVFRDRLLEAGKKEGKDFEYVEYTDEGHGSDDIQQKLRMWGRMGEFFQREL